MDIVPNVPDGGAPLPPPRHYHITHGSSIRGMFEKTLVYPSGSDDKESAYNAGEPGSISGSRRSPGEGNSNPFQCSCLRNPMDTGAWWATVQGVAQESETTYQLNNNNNKVQGVALHFKITFEDTQVRVWAIYPHWISLFHLWRNEYLRASVKWAFISMEENLPWTNTLSKPVSFPIT